MVDEHIHLKSLSGRAFGILVLVVTTGIQISAENIARHIKEGEKAIGTALRELRSLKLMELKYQNINHAVQKYTVITSKGYEFVETFLRMPSPNSPAAFGNVLNSRNRHFGDIDTLNEQNSNLSLNTNSTYISKPNTEILENEILINGKKPRGQVISTVLPPQAKTNIPARTHAERREIEAQKLIDFKSKEEAIQKSNFQKRQVVPREEWTVSDVGFEFAEKVWDIWHFPPWSMTKSRFRAALSTARKKHASNGKQEVQALELFLRQQESRLREFQTVDDLWKLFIHQFSGLIKQVSLSMRTPESDRVAKEAYEIGIRKLRLGNDPDTLAKKVADEERSKNKEKVNNALFHLRVIRDSHKFDPSTASELAIYEKAILIVEVDLAKYEGDTKVLESLENKLQKYVKVELEEVENVLETMHYKSPATYL